MLAANAHKGLRYYTWTWPKGRECKASHTLWINLTSFVFFLLIFVYPGCPECPGCPGCPESPRVAHGCPWRIFGCSWLPLGCPWVPLGRPWLPLGCPWVPLWKNLLFFQPADSIEAERLLCKQQTSTWMKNRRSSANLIKNFDQQYQNYQRTLKVDRDWIQIIRIRCSIMMMLTEPQEELNS